MASVKKSSGIKKSSRKMALMVQVDGIKINNNNPGKFCSEAGMMQHRLT